MRRVAASLLLVLLLVPGIACGQKVNYIGTWSNKKEGFDVAAMGLRSDGRGYLAVSVDTSMLRWKNSANGITLAVAKGGKIRDVSLRYDRSTDRFSMSIPGGPPIEFSRINSNEPADLESEYEARLEKENEERVRRNPLPPVTVVPSAKELGNSVARFSGDKSPGRMSVTSANGKTVHLVKLSQLCSVELRTLRAGTIPKVTRLYSQDKPAGVFSTIVLVPEDRVVTLRAWLDSKGIKNSKGYWVFNSPWRAEGYYEFCEINIKDNSALFNSTVTHITEETLAPFEYPVEVLVTSFDQIQ